MKLNWSKYWYDFSRNVLKHVGTALAGWGGINVASSQGMDVPTLDWKALGVFIVSAGIIPGISSFWSTTPLPDVETTTLTIESSKPVQPKPEQDP